jgi:hypothetical protein
MMPAPPLDRRRAEDVADQLRKLLGHYLPGWTGRRADRTPDLGEAMVRIFARYAEIVIERLNRAPERNLLAFLDMIGVALLPPVPARVPLTFSLAPGSTADALVPAGTQVAALPLPGGERTAVFETARDLAVLAIVLDSVCVCDPRSGLWADLLSAGAPAPPAVPLFKGTEILDHSLFIGLDMLRGCGLVATFDLTVTTDATPPGGLGELEWTRLGPAGEAALPLQPAVHAPPHPSGKAVVTYSFAGLPRFVPVPLQGTETAWLRARRIAPLPRGTEAPRLLSVSARARFAGDARPEAAFANTAPLDITKDFQPFGARPALGDAFYLAAGDALALPGAVVSLGVTVSAGAAVGPQRELRLAWEHWDGEAQAWVPVADLADGTGNLVAGGTVAFRLGAKVAPRTVNGVAGHWLRVRIDRGDYGADVTYEPVDPKDITKGYVVKPPTFAPPSLARLKICYALEISDDPPPRLVVRNGWLLEPVPAGTDCLLFRATAEDCPALYLGFVLPPGRQGFPNAAVSLLLDLEEPGEAEDEAAATGPPHLAWEAWLGEATDWRPVAVRDDTEGLSRAGVIELLVPAGFARRLEFGRDRYWLRCRWSGGRFAFPPRLRRVVPNTVMAADARLVPAEILGSSDGGAGQRFVTASRPVLAGDVILEVREPDLPSSAEHAALAASLGGKPVAAEAGEAVWVRWREVAEFSGSGPRDRDFVLDRVAGEVRFGDGANGLIPPCGADNLRLRYRTGGGSGGNRPAGTVTGMLTTLPYVAGVTNPLPAAGGADAETPQAVLERGPRLIRHRDRAVTREDFEDLALSASPGVARARCAPLRDLAASDPRSERPGWVSVIVVPRSEAALPVPGRILLTQVAAHLDARRSPLLTLRVVPPVYRSVSLEVEVVAASLDRAAAVKAGVAEALAQFLHPLTGGFDGSGWDFGREPHRSDFIRRIGLVAGVDHVSRLEIRATSEGPDADPELALIHAGTLNIIVQAAP